jgi:hypothetical protein
MRCIEGHPRVRVRNIVGRTDAAAELATILARADRRAVTFFEHERMSAAVLSAITEINSGPLDPDRAYPWDAVQNWMNVDDLRRSYRAIVRRLSREV